MAVYFVTGKLGSGKTLACVGRIKEYLHRGAPVATNLDIRLNKMFGPKARNACVYRLPDKPGIEDLESIGIGNSSYDESKNGLLVLDECGTWFNSRQWADKERQQVINWFLHARKKGWDVIFIVQNIAIVDKQARMCLAEHVVYCRRMDKMTIPFVGFLYKAFTGSRLPFPKLHVASVRYGDQQTSLIVDRWWYFGVDLYDCYDTKQAFSDFYSDSTYRVLPPWYTHGRYMIPLTWSRAVRLTKIHWKRFSRPVLSGAFFAAGIAAAIYFREPVQLPPVEPVAKVEEGAQAQPAVEAASVPPAPDQQSAKPLTPVRDRYASWVITGHLQLGQKQTYLLKSPDGEVVSLDNLTAKGLDVYPVDGCQVRLVSATDLADSVTVYANVCSPDTVGREAVASENIPARPLAEYVPDPRVARAAGRSQQSTGQRLTIVNSGKPGHLW